MRRQKRPAQPQATIPCEYGELIEQVLLWLANDAVAPCDGGAKRLIPMVRPATESFQEVEPIFHAGDNLLGRKDAYERRCKFDCEREAIECPTNLANGFAVFGVRNEAWLGRASAYDKQLRRCRFKDSL